MPDEWFAWSKNVGATVDLTCSLTFQWELCGPAIDSISRWIRPLMHCVWHTRSSNSWLVQQKAGEIHCSSVGGVCLILENQSGFNVFSHSICYYPWRRSLLYSPSEMFNAAIVTAPSLTAKVNRSTLLHYPLPACMLPGSFFWSCFLGSPHPSILVLPSLCFSCSLFISSLQYPIQLVLFIVRVSRWL